MSGKTVSSPASTGGAGTIFEQHVGAYWLAQLLVRAIPPIIHDCTVVEVNFQTEHLGWNTDDLLIVGQTASGSGRKLACQVKRTFTVSAANEDCKKTIQDFWKDFGNARCFLPSDDRFALVTLRGTNSLLEYFQALLDCARAARDGAEFEHRLSMDGFIADKAVRYCDEFRAIVADLEGRTVTAAELWPFLRVLHILSLDLNTATAQAEATIKTLLAYTTGESDPIAAAEDSWKALLDIAGKAMPSAGSFGREDLPEALRKRHEPVGETEQGALRALKDHSSLILGGIRSTIGNNLHLRRTALVQQVIAGLESVPVILVSGPAGSGKSAVAKDALALLSTDQFSFCFRAEEFAEPHFDATLQNAQVPASAATLGAILASQGRKVLLVESVERLLEKSTRDAFTDLLTLARGDVSWRIVLTCRDYSTDLVRACFLAASGIQHAVVAIPQLEDDELGEVEAVHPALSRPLSHPRLRRILRNPYFLDKALQIPWSPQKPLPESERDLRALFWREIVRADDRLAAAMPRRRGETFKEIAVRRARALTMYVSSEDLDAGAVDDLRNDSLIVTSGDSALLVAPAHDVLEDWAILKWIEDEHGIHGESFQGLFAAIGTHPAVRRSYRKWVAELVERDAEAADRLFQAAVLDARVPAQFRDDTLVSLLQSPSSPAFLEKQSSRLFENDRQLLKRVIHLLRVACVTTAAWLPSGVAHGSLLNVPNGPAWGSVLRLVHTHVEEFPATDRPLLLGLIEDWGRGVSWMEPYPEGADSVAAIAHSLLPGFDNYYSEGPRKRTLQVIAKIPKASRARFQALLRGTEDSERDRLVDDFQDMIFAGTEGSPAARDLPDVVVSAATEYLLCSENDLRRSPGFAGSLDLEPLFGLKDRSSRDFFPASAYRGPFFTLLRYHPRKGLGLLLAIFNHSAEWYAHPRVSEPVEPPIQIGLTFADGTARKQWSNGRLWNWYRGTSVGPYVLQSLLMALERWLFELAESQPEKLDGVLVDILRRSDSAALTAVVASVATAFPHASGEALLVLLGSPLCILLDRQRMVTESQAPSRLTSLMNMGGTENRVFELERKEADERPHRQSDLETAIANLQFGPLASRVYETLDKNRAALPPVSRQNDGDRVWRLAMHRMDLRQYVASDAAAPADTAATKRTQGRILLTPNDPEPDVKAMVDKSGARFAAMNSRLVLLMWGLQVFQHEEKPGIDPPAWREKLGQAQNSAAIDLQPEDDLGGVRNGPGFIAAVCVRDHWEELSEVERDWCTGVLCAEVMRKANLWNYHERMQRMSMSADRACASVLPLLCNKLLARPRKADVQKAFIAGLTHAIHEVRSYAAWGVASHLWSIDRDLTMRCVNAIATEATLVQQALQKEEKQPYDRRRQIDDIEAETASIVRKQFGKPGAISEDAFHTLDIFEWFGADATGRILAILAEVPTEPAATAAFIRAAKTLVAWWDADDERDEPRQRNSDAETAVAKLLETFLLRTSSAAAAEILAPILEATDRHPGKIHWILRGIITAEDSRPNTPQFWVLWGLFASRIRSAQWLADIGEPHAIGNPLISAAFLGAHWKEDVRHWRSLKGHAHHVHKLFEDLPPSSTVLEDYVRFLYHIGEQSLPGAFLGLAKRLHAEDSHTMLEKADTIFMLEVLLQRFVYGKPLELKRELLIREAVLNLLDTLVDNGSSAAFRMRDDFVTPASAS